MKLKIALLAAAATTSLSSAASIGVNFMETIANHPNQQLASGTSAGLEPQKNWNNTGGVSGMVSSLVDSAGATTGAEVTWSAGTGGGVWGDGGANVDANNGVGNAQLRRGYLDDNGTSPITFSVADVPYPMYDLIVYYSTDTLGAQQFQGVTANGSFARPDATTGALYSENSAYDSTNTARIFGLTGDLTATMDARNTSGTGRATIAGFQIVAVPEPSSTLLVGLSGLALLMRRRK
ncbi:PEP-CTERM sorting domain-containing protein [Akkermansiaceae bacterium]|nr:PEP-CTERM sorting domain-containing protein [Akkermansiaceae bacterium]MDB4462398.1 PEP-CTERM sorting domain-containing protein [Akkermansiaceae bacterium]